MTDRRAPWIWAALVIPTWLVLVLCTHWEPVIRDGWGHLNWHRLFHTTPTNVWEFAKGSYVHNNPRLGQVLTLLVFTPGPWHEIVTPLVELALFYLLTTLALGRWPSLRRSDDALLFATILALVGVSAPLLGPMLFYRPFTGNYLYGLVLNLALLVPYRLRAEDGRTYGWWWAPLLLVLGVAAGLCNEHTGPGVAALIAIALAAEIRARRIPPVWMIAGLVGLIAGGLALYFAPGQDIRYNALATQTGVLGRIVARGAAGNTKIIAAFVLYLMPVLPWIALGVAARRTSPERAQISRPRAIAAILAVAAAVLFVLTLLASPKQGPRLYFASIALACTALASWVVPQLQARLPRAIGWLMAAAVLVYVGARCVLIYRVAGPEFQNRLALIQHAQLGATVTVPHYSQPRSRWFLGDDFEVPTLRKGIAGDYGLTAIELSGPQRPATPSGNDDP